MFLCLVLCACYVWLCVYDCTCMDMSVCVCVCIDWRILPHYSIVLHCTYWGSISHWTKRLPVQPLSLASLPRRSYLYRQSSGITSGPLHPLSFYMDPRNLNASLHTCVESTLSSNSPPQPYGVCFVWCSWFDFSWCCSSGLNIKLFRYLSGSIH